MRRNMPNVNYTGLSLTEGHREERRLGDGSIESTTQIETIDPLTRPVDCESARRHKIPPWAMAKQRRENHQDQRYQRHLTFPKGRAALSLASKSMSSGVPIPC
jgi:hypothetical protein